MKKLTTTKVRRTAKLADRGLTIGIDLGDRSSCYCVLDESGEIVLEQKVSTTAKAIEGVFAAMAQSRIALETGTHSPWVSRLLSGIGHQVIVANARNVRLIGESQKKDDRMDARTLAKLVRVDPQLLAPVKHRSAQAQMHLTIIRARATVVRARTAMINAVRGLAKSNGERLRGCNSKAVNVEIGKDLNGSLQVALRPLLEEISALSLRICQYNKQIEELSRNHYPEIALLTQVDGVGILTAITFLLTFDDPHRFHNSRDAGCYVGLQPARRNSGLSQPQLHISKEGNGYLRTLLVQCAHHILGPFGVDSDLRRWGLKLAECGGKSGKNRAVVAVARKLAVLLHRLWVSGEAYEPFRCHNQAALAAA